MSSGLNKVQKVHKHFNLVEIPSHTDYRISNLNVNH